MKARSAATLLLLVAVAALVVLGSAWLARGERSLPAVDDAAEPVAPQREARGNALDSPSSESVAAEQPADVALHVEAPEQTSTLVRGTLVLVDGWGVEHAHEDGSLEIVSWTPPGKRQRNVTAVRVEDGRWEAQVPAHTARSFANAALSGLPLCNLIAQELPSHGAAASEMRVTGHASYPARISVVDAATQHDLEDVAILPLELSDPRGHPGDLSPTIADAVSPIELASPGSARALYLVGARGHAWQRVEWSHLSSAPRVVELEPSGSLVVRVDGPLEACSIEVLAADGAPYASVARARASLLLEGVAPGPYRVALVPRAEAVRAQFASLAEASVTVTRSAVSEVELRADLGERPHLVEVGGQVRMSPEWSPGGPHLLLRALGASAKWHMDSDGLLGGVDVERAGDAWRFHSDRAVADTTYLLVEQRTWCLREVHADARGALSCELEIPDPITVLVQVFDRDTGLPIGSSRVDWIPPSPPGVPRPRASGPLWIEATERPGIFRARVPAWDGLDFEAQAPGHAAATATLRPSPGSPSELRIALDRL